MADPRTIQHGVSPMFTARWSPRAMSGEPLTEKEILRVFEAAKWAPSAYNAQPWKFVYARRGTPSWEKLLGLLVPFNQAWCSKVYVYTLQSTYFSKGICTLCNNFPQPIRAQRNTKPHALIRCWCSLDVSCA